jgi:hypothetical protein
MRGSKTRQGVMETRLNNWLWLRLQEKGHDYPVEILGTDEVRGDRDCSELLDESRQYLLPQEEFDWILENKRQAEWLRSYFRRKLDVSTRSLPSRLLGKYLIFAAIDTYDASFEEKLDVVRKMQALWYEYIKEDVIFGWFLKNEKISRCKTAWDWVTKHKQEDLYGIAPFSNVEDLMIFYDRLGLTKEEKERDILKIQRFWHQRESRAKEGDRKQYNFVLFKHAVADLDKLAKKHDLKRSQMLEVLIQNEVDNGTYAKKMGGK